MKSKFTKKISFIVLFAVLFSSLFFMFNFTVNAAADDEEIKANPSGAYIKCTATVLKPDTTDKTLAHCSYVIKKTDYVIQEGDMLEYDVKIDFDEYGGFGALDGDVQNFGTSLRDAPGMSDQNGVGVHIGTDFREYAYDEWYHRIINIGTTEDEAERFTVGKKLINVQFGVHPSSPEPFDFTATVLYDNIVITNNGEVKYVIFRDAEDFNPEDVKKIGGEFVTPSVECLVFTDEEIQAFKDAEEAKIRELEAKEASKAEAEASREASREQASIDASIAESEAANRTEAISEPDDSASDDGGVNIGLILGIAGGAVVIVIVIILIAATGKKKDGKK